MHSPILTAMALLGVLWASSAPGQTPTADRLREQRDACALQPVQAGGEFVVASVGVGETLANVQLSPPNLSTVLHVDVASGQKPIDVFLIATVETIFDFTGDVDRIRRVVVGPNASAVRGIAADRVEFPNLHGCMLPYVRGHYGGQQPEERRTALAVMFGRAPDREIEAPSADQLSLPDGVVTSKRDEAERNRKRRTGAERDLYDRHPAGFRELDPATLVAPVKVLLPNPSPAEAGLIQLEQRGDIRPAAPDEIRRWIDGASQPYRTRLFPNFRLTINFDYAVLRPVQLPVGTGKNFLFLAGVPNPAGNAKPDSGCVASMDGFRISDDEFCFREFQDIHELHNVLATEDHGECRLLSTPTGAVIDAVSVHEPKAEHTFGSDDRTISPIDVNVRRTGQVVLVLSTYNPAIWRVTLAPATRIAGVLLMGAYDRSKVEGLPDGTPVVSFDLQSRTSPSIDSRCARLAGYADAYHGGPAALLLDREVKALVGRGLDSLYGEYAATEIDIP